MSEHLTALFEKSKQNSGCYVGCYAMWVQWPFIPGHVFSPRFRRMMNSNISIRIINKTRKIVHTSPSRQSNQFLMGWRPLITIRWSVERRCESRRGVFLFVNTIKDQARGSLVDEFTHVFRCQTTLSHEHICGIERDGWSRVDWTRVPNSPCSLNV